MKTTFFLLICFSLFSFCPVPEKIADNAHAGFYIQVKDLTDRTSHRYIVDSKDSVNDIFNYFFNSELELGNVDRPISIYNGKRDFYLARVTVYEKANGKKDFKHLKYPKVYVRPEKNRRSKLKPVIL